AQPKPAPGAEKPNTAPAPAPGRDVRPGSGRQGAPPPKPLDARQSVFSQDGRLYRPVRRLCHELLARLPSVGIDIYRSNYEVLANEMFEQALKDGSISALEQVASRYFITLPAGRAMVVLADRLMHEGRYRAAVQLLRDLVEIYPADNRKRLGISVVWCRFKMALCLRLAGEVAAAHETVLVLAKDHPDESLRILGELQAVADLPASAMFANEVLDLLADPRRPTEATWLGPTTEELLPLWQYRFKNAEPYKDAKPTNNDNSQQVFRGMMGEGIVTMTMPHAGRYGPATWVGFSSQLVGESGTQALLPRAVFLEHFCLRVVDAASGLVLLQGDGVDEPPQPRDGHPRVRIAASDFALLRPVEDNERRYVVLGHQRSTTASAEALKSSELVAYERGSLKRAWSSMDWPDGEGGLRDVTFLAAPTVFGERLLLPSLRRGGYTLDCLDRRTGRPLWNAPLHAGGSAFFKAPGSPVVVQGGIAYVVTNAGCLAAVDAFAGDLRWVRRYERGDPLRKVSRPRRTTREEVFFQQQQFANSELPGLYPNDVIARDGLVVIAPCDSDLVMCLDGATGQIVWLLDATTIYAPYGKLRAVVGASRENLFVLSDTSLVCIGLEGGLLKWSRELPLWNGTQKSFHRGRGCVVGEWVVVPGERELLVFDAAGKEPMRRLPLPAFDAGRDPLGGSYNIVSHGPWLAVGYQGGVEVFSSREALLRIADETPDTLRRAAFLVQAGQAEAAEAALREGIRAGVAGSTQLHPMARQLLSLTRERAAHMSREGNLRGGLAALDNILELMHDRSVRLNWHLARVEICKEVGELRAHEDEQQRLYDYMEGKK
ncbi:MAG TPA: PQQ-binding-like beta-propeller repeat protein, partial [Planctomycetota bacterium]|nr:PQQ-binding-like beta-propeller repeat protein [Planctomycetota bacterium]